MKVADVTYTGRRTHARYRGPSGEEYVFSSGTPTGTATVAVDSYRDAVEFERCGGYQVDWSSFGKAIHQAGGSLNAVEQTLSDLVYQEKQSLAASLGLDGSGSEDALDDRLRPVIEDLREEMEDGPNR